MFFQQNILQYFSDWVRRPRQGDSDEGRSGSASQARAARRRRRRRCRHRRHLIAMAIPYYARCYLTILRSESIQINVTELIFNIFSTQHSVLLCNSRVVIGSGRSRRFLLSLPVIRARYIRVGSKFEAVSGWYLDDVYTMMWLRLWDCGILTFTVCLRYCLHSNIVLCKFIFATKRNSIFIEYNCLPFKNSSGYFKNWTTTESWLNSWDQSLKSEMEYSQVAK